MTKCLLFIVCRIDMFRPIGKSDIHSTTASLDHIHAIMTQ